MRRLQNSSDYGLFVGCKVNDSQRILSRPAVCWHGSSFPVSNASDPGLNKQEIRVARLHNNMSGYSVANMLQ